MRDLAQLARARQLILLERKSVQIVKRNSEFFVCMLSCTLLASLQRKKYSMNLIQVIAAHFPPELTLTSWSLRKHSCDEIPSLFGLAHCISHQKPIVLDTASKYRIGLTSRVSNDESRSFPMACMLIFASNSMCKFFKAVLMPALSSKL
jgi:hypothetical protein